ncbi:hypothetical protein AT984_10885 [Paucibacter sp. KCTC 42545]|nr:hypothetical protein AT984_10885 [Paucibacter sp. KCTC 42545]
MGKHLRTGHFWHYKLANSAREIKRTLLSREGRHFLNADKPSVRKAAISLGNDGQAMRIGLAADVRQQAWRGAHTLAKALAHLVLWAAAMTSLQARAWGVEGHKLVASLAESQLSPEAMAEAARLLAREPGATLASVANWADEVRSSADTKWHTVSFPRGNDCRYEAAFLCPEGQCVVSAIERQTAILHSKAPDAQRLVALKYLVHFVGDIHQPLHGGYADDKRGRLYAVQAFGQDTDMHALWDSGLIRNWPGGRAALRSAVRAETPLGGGAPKDWAEESCRLMRSPGFYPEGHDMDASYPAQWRTTVVQRLAQSARRLAELLNSSLGSP